MSVQCLDCQNYYVHIFNYDKVKGRCSIKKHIEVNQLSEKEINECKEFIKKIEIVEEEKVKESPLKKKKRVVK